MKKTNKLLKDNRGAALISVMIAVAFISILASALLYISYSNYQMKVVNYQSKVNFYGVEKDMTEVVTVIRNNVATSTNPLQALQEAVGYTKVGDVERYSPSCLANLVYSAVDEDKNDYGQCEVTLSLTDTATFSAVDSSNSNFVVTTSGNLKTITLKGVVIEHETGENGYVHKITTDLVFYIRESVQKADAGGVGEFSVLTDGSVTVDGGSSTMRVTTYGNVFMGPGEYKYTGGVINPGAADALVLKGESYFTQKGDYMVLFGNLVLEDNAVLNIMSGRLTVIGDIIVRDNAVLMCKGDLFMAPGNNPQTTVPYKIDCSEANSDPKTSQVVLNKALTDPTAVTTLTDSQYTELLTSLGLNDDDTTNDGIIKKILTTDGYNNMSGLMSNSAGVWNDSFHGMNYRVTYWGQENLNASDCQNSLVFARNRYDGNSISNAAGFKDIIMSDGSNNLNTTIIAFGDLVMGDNAKHTVLTQLGSEAFNMLTARTPEEYARYMGYYLLDGEGNYTYDSDGKAIIDLATATTEYDKTHTVASDKKIEYYNISGNKVSEQLTVGNLFVADPNKAVNAILSASIGGGGGTPVIETASGYANWVKE